MTVQYILNAFRRICERVSCDKETLYESIVLERTEKKHTGRKTWSQSFTSPRQYGPVIYRQIYGISEWPFAKPRKHPLKNERERWRESHTRKRKKRVCFRFHYWCFKNISSTGKECPGTDGTLFSRWIDFERVSAPSYAVHRKFLRFDIAPWEYEIPHDFVSPLNDHFYEI